MRPAVLLSVLVALAGCEDLSFGDKDGGAGDKVVSTDNPDGTTTTRVDTRDMMKWVYFDFETRAAVEPADPSKDTAWDLMFQRFLAGTNGGVTGKGGVEVALLPSADFDALAKAPPSGFISDMPDPPGGDAGTGRVFHLGEGWYIYDITVHTLTPRDIVYVVKTGAANYYKMKITSYYDHAGTPGFFTFKWKKIDPPSGSDLITVDASAPGVWVYLNAKTGPIPAPASPDTSTAWDLAFSARQIRTNSGTSGPGRGGAQPSQAAYSTLVTSGTIGFVVDAGGVNPALDAWVENQAFLVRTAGGDYTKFTVASFGNGVYGIRWAPLLRQVSVATFMVDASGATPAYGSLRLGTPITVADPATSREWDLSFLGTKIRTNGGASGGGQGAAADPMETDLASIVSGTIAPFVDDQAGGNPVLDGWNNPDNTPKNKVLIVRLADGGYAKLKIGLYDAGKYTFFYSYAGAGRGDF
jgi:hypothetical protein